MLWTVTANPAVDFTYYLPQLTPGEVHRTSRVRHSPGGKGVNVSRVLAALGHASIMTGFMGTETVRLYERLLGELGPVRQYLRPRWVHIPGQTRHAVGIFTEDGTTTVINEVGPKVAVEQWHNLFEIVRNGIRPGDVISVCGSAPAGAPTDFARKIVEIAKEGGALSIVDVTGPALLEAAQGGVDLVKPNHRELLAATGAATIAEGAQKLLDLGAGNVVVTEGPQGMTLFAKGKSWHGSCARQVVGNSMGAGDAALAGFMAAIEDSREKDFTQLLVSALPSAVALSASAVATPVAGEINEEVYQILLPEVSVES